MGITFNDIKGCLKVFGAKAWNHRADIAFVSGTVGTAIGTYLFVKAAKKNEPVIEAYKERKKEIAESEDCSDEEKRHATRDNTIAVVKGSAKNYVLPATVSAVSYGLQIYSHVKTTSDLSKLNTALTASVAAFEALKQRIIATEGEDKWREYAYGEKLGNQTIVDMETGEILEDGEKTLGTPCNLDFSFPFTAETSPEYQDYKGANKNRLCIIQSAWEQRLHMDGKKGFVMLRPVFESVFGAGSLRRFPAEWANAGWPAMNPDGTINHISFGFHPVAENPTLNIKGRPLESFPQATQDFWTEKRNDVRIVFEGVVPNIYDVI